MTFRQRKHTKNTRIPTDDTHVGINIHNSTMVSQDSSVLGRSLAEIAGSNPAGKMDVCVVCVVQ